jgi:antitoxin (DNA-binding transcriptional repressor) of toxin-antitoxin stability system
MSTLSLKNLATNVDRLTALIRGGKPVRITDEGRTVATIAPPRAAVRKATGKRVRQPALSMVRHLAGTLTGPADLSSNPAHLKGYGE